MGLLTLAAIAKEIGIPESTARFYRDRYEQYIPSVGEGRSRRYPAEAVKVLRYISERMKKGEPGEELEAELKIRFALNMDIEPQNNKTAATMILGEVMQGMVRGILHEEMAPVIERLDDLRKENEELRQYIAATVEERDQKLTATMRELMEQKQKKGFLSRLFGKG